MHVWNTETRYLSWAGIIGNWGGNLRIEDGLLWARSLGLFEGLRLHVPFQINLSHGWVSIILVKNLWQDIYMYCCVRKITICVQNNKLAIFTCKILHHHGKKNCVPSLQVHDLATLSQNFIPTCHFPYYPVIIIQSFCSDIGKLFLVTSTFFLSYYIVNL